jgi:hypothetical protein
MNLLSDSTAHNSLANITGVILVFKHKYTLEFGYCVSHRRKIGCHFFLPKMIKKIGAFFIDISLCGGTVG